MESSFDRVMVILRTYQHLLFRSPASAFGSRPDLAVLNAAASVCGKPWCGCVFSFLLGADLQVVGHSGSVKLKLSVSLCRARQSAEKSYLQLSPRPLETQHMNRKELGRWLSLNEFLGCVSA